MPTTILLFGAGFSYNWSGRLASEVTNDTAPIHELERYAVQGLLAGSALSIQARP
jgi:hypothetical protein